MSLDRFPALEKLYADLQKLHAEEHVRRRMRLVESRPDAAGRVPVRVPWLRQRYMMAPPQAEVVRQLAHAHANCRYPWMDEQTLLSRAGAAGVRKLADLFRGHPAWGVLVLPGPHAGTYQIAPAPGEARADAGERVEPAEG